MVWMEYGGKKRTWQENSQGAGGRSVGCVVIVGTESVQQCTSRKSPVRWRTETFLVRGVSTRSLGRVQKCTGSIGGPLAGSWHSGRLIPWSCLVRFISVAGRSSRINFSPSRRWSCRLWLRSVRNPNRRQRCQSASWSLATTKSAVPIFGRTGTLQHGCTTDTDSADLYFI